jgi:hypothetical protein
MARATTCRTLFLVTLAVVVALAMVQPAAAALLWGGEVVDDPSNANVGAGNAIAVDSAGRPHIAYLDTINFHLKHARKTASGTWRIEVVDTSGVVGFSIALALDASDHPHISYHRSASTIAVGDLRYAKGACPDPPSEAACTWTKQTVHAGVHSQTAAGNTSLALDGAGNPNISYFDHTNGKLKWARWEGTSWGLTDVTPSAGGSASIAIDANNFPQIVYAESGLLKHVKVVCYFILCGWGFDTIGGGREVGKFQLDAAGSPHVAYRGSAPASISYSTRSCSTCSWITQTVGSQGSATSAPALALNGSGAPRIAFLSNFGFHARNLNYAAPASGSWSVVVVASDVSDFSDVSLDLDASGHPHISYENEEEDSLRYAYGYPNPLWPPVVPICCATFR